MKIRTKLNLALTGVFILALGASSYVAWQVLKENAREQVFRNAGFMMATALSIRDYTIKQVRPHLQPLMDTQFFPQTVPAYAATETIEHLRQTYPAYSYREAVLNPTNPRDRATSWEATLIRQFQQQPDLSEITDTHDTWNREVLYIARPIRITNPNCLGCHSKPENAPQTMLQKYGSKGGFGWKVNEIVGTQVVTVPTEFAINNAKRTFVSFVGSIVGVYIAFFMVLNLLLGRMIIRPISELADNAIKISTGDFSLPEFAAVRRDEIGDLSKAFNRLRRSLKHSMDLIRPKTE